jgi:lipopolysaccharide transport system ATP-binding protein
LIVSDVVIKVENLSKRYKIGKRERYKALRDTLTDAIGAPLRIARAALRRDGEEVKDAGDDQFWALKNVSFEVKRGEVVGIIGRNGAGKSTLLKILSRITRPTEGRISMRGRVGALLEVGTGFHPELTGRENIYLNGAILGMKRADIIRKFDEIVAFAEVEQFIDTPVKHYSSGMYMRLAFAVAAHLEPEILVVDEVLAVGDTEFQNKCLGKMSDVAREGRTILFVSHNMAAVNRLCRRGIILKRGCVLIDADILSTTRTYLQSDYGTSTHREWDDLARSPGDAICRLRYIAVFSQGMESDTVDIRRPVIIEMEFWNFKPGAFLMPALSFFDGQGTLLFVSAPFTNQEWRTTPRAPGSYTARCVVPGNLFAEGIVRVTTEVSTSHPVYEVHVLEHDCVTFQIVDLGKAGSVRAGWGRPLPGVIRPELHWEQLRTSTEPASITAIG